MSAFPPFFNLVPLKTKYKISCSPSGCTFWGKKPWSRKKKILWQLGTLIGAPVGISLIAGIAIPAMVIGIPVYVGRKVRISTVYADGFFAGRRGGAKVVVVPLIVKRDHTIYYTIPLNINHW